MKYVFISSMGFYFILFVHVVSCFTGDCYHLFIWFALFIFFIVF